MPLPPAGLKALYGGQMVDEMLTASVRAVPKRLADAGFEFQHPTIDAALAAALR
jgi:NAD dependent epimerase/dehydratase family enzyme